MRSYGGSNLSLVSATDRLLTRSTRCSNVGFGPVANHSLVWAGGSILFVNICFHLSIRLVFTLQDTGALEM